MNKKSIILCIALVMVLLVGIIIGMHSLYSDGNSGKGKASPGNYPLLKAVPSDAALVMHFKSLDKALDILNDSTMAFGGIADAGQKKFKAFISNLNDNKKSIGSIKNQPASIALLNSGGMIPLLILDGGKASADTTSDALSVFSLAKQSGLNSGYKSDSRNYIMVSESETIIGSSIRHIENGLSILDSDGMREAVGNTSGDDVVFISGTYSGKIQTTYFASKYNQYSEVFKKLGLWTSLSIEEASEKHVSVKGHTWGKQDGSSFFSYARNSSSSDVKVCDVLPSHTDAVISIPVGDIKKAIEAREKYLDAIGKIDQYKTKNKEYKKAIEMTASDWAKTVGIKEVAIAWFHDDKNLEPILLTRISSKRDANGIEDNPMAGALSLLFGNVFTLVDETHMINTKGWQIIGSEKALNAYMAEGFLNNTLKLQMADCNISGRIPSKNCNFFLYWCPSNDPAIISNVFKKDAADAFKNVIKGVGFVPSTLSITDGRNINIDIDRLNITKSKAPIVERDTTVVIPQGPFKVKNSATGETNYLSQAANLYLSLKDENGKGIWSVPFKEKICGSVESIDWYQNGKIQFLFGAGSSLHLVDRIGRFVNPFPVDLGKEILIGPAAYDFSGVGGYTAVILHKDNTIELYNLHGKKPEHWKGITSTETIKALPELLEAKGKKYWVVRTGLQTQIYGFNGGEPLTKNEGDKMIRPDSPITVDEKGNISATCYDGKERNIKF